MTIDSHQHFWIFDSVKYSWINENMSAIQRDFLPQDLYPLLQKNEVDACIAVQGHQTEENNSFLINLATKNKFIKGVVGWVNLSAANVDERLSFYSHQPFIKGFRHVLQDEVQRDFMLTNAFKNGISKLEKYNYTYDILILTDQISYSEELVKAFPKQKFVIDHLAKPPIKSQKITDWAVAIKKIANYQNVSCKVSGMVTEADWQNWKPEDFEPYLDVVFEAFGTKRLMYGSDWPVCNIAGGYDNSISLLKNYTKKLTTTEQQDLFGNNAALFYNIS